MAARIDTITIDCADARRVAAFWCTALGYRITEIDEEGALIEDGDGAIAVYFQVVPEPKTVKNRVHLDLRSPESMEKEVQRLASAGAASVRLVEEGGSFWTVMRDPEGNEFCVLRGPNDDPPSERPS